MKKTKFIYHIRIEGCDEEQMQKLFEEIQNKYSFYDNCVLEETDNLADTIINYEDDRYKETGYLEVLDKKTVMKAKEYEEMLALEKQAIDEYISNSEWANRLGLLDCLNAEDRKQYEELKRRRD